MFERNLLSAAELSRTAELETWLWHSAHFSPNFYMGGWKVRNFRPMYFKRSCGFETKLCIWNQKVHWKRKRLSYLLPKFDLMGNRRYNIDPPPPTSGSWKLVELSITQLRIGRLCWNLTCWCNVWVPWGCRIVKSTSGQIQMADGPKRSILNSL